MCTLSLLSLLPCPRPCVVLSSNLVAAVDVVVTSTHHLIHPMHSTTQDQPPAACSQLLTSCAFRQLNVEALNRLAVNAFVDKQDDASPQDMARLMAALSLVRCCSSSSSNQVRGLTNSARPFVDLNVTFRLCCDCNSTHHRTMLSFWSRCACATNRSTALLLTAWRCWVRQHHHEYV